MNPRRKKRLGVVLAILFGLSATIGLIIYALNQNMDFSIPRLSSCMAKREKAGNRPAFTYWRYGGGRFGKT